MQELDETVRDMDKNLITQTEQSSQQLAQKQKKLNQPAVSQEKKGQIYREMSINRKSEGFQTFTKFEDQQIQITRQHLMCIDTVVEQLDLRVTLSDRGLQGIAQFLKERIQIETQNIQLLSKPSIFLGVFKQGEKVLYPRLTQSLESLSQLHQSQGKQLNQLIQQIEKLLKDKFEANQLQYGKIVQTQRDKIKSMIKAAKEIRASAFTKSKKLHKVYDEMMANGGKHKKRTKDLFNGERKYKQLAIEQLQLQTKIGEEVVKYYDEVLKQEYERLMTIQQVLKMYLEKFHETYSGTTPSAQVQMVIKNFMQPVEELTIPISEVGYIAEALKCEQVGIYQIRTYLCQYPLQLIQPTVALNNPFIIKQFVKIQRDAGTIMSKWQSVTIIVSIDQNLLIFDTDDNTIPHHKAQFKFPLENTILEIGKKKDQISLVYKQPGMLYNSTQSIPLKFLNQDTFDELQFYLNQDQK